MSLPTPVGLATPADNARVQSILHEAAPVPEPSPDGVTLPGGWIDRDGILHRNAVVRELTGADEEALSRARDREGQFDWNRYFGLVVERGLASIDGIEADQKMRWGLCIGDWDYLLLQIRIATYGDEYETRIVCPKCAHESEVVFELGQDVKIRHLEDADVLYRKVELRRGRIAEIRLPQRADQEEAATDMRRTAAEQNSIILSRCVRSIDGESLFNPLKTLQELGGGDRRILVKHIADTQPGPRMGEVVASCAKCQIESEIALSMAALFL